MVFDDLDDFYDWWNSQSPSYLRSHTYRIYCDNDADLGQNKHSTNASVQKSARKRV